MKMFILKGKNPKWITKKKFTQITKKKNIDRITLESPLSFSNPPTYTIT